MASAQHIGFVHSLNIVHTVQQQILTGTAIKIKYQNKCILPPIEGKMCTI